MGPMVLADVPAVTQAIGIDDAPDQAAGTRRRVIADRIGFAVVERIDPKTSAGRSDEDVVERSPGKDLLDRGEPLFPRAVAHTQPFSFSTMPTGSGPTGRIWRWVTPAAR